MKLKYIIPIILLLVASVLGITVSGGVTEDIPIGKGIAEDITYTFDWRLDDSDLPEFMETTVLFQGQEYDIHDELFLKRDTPSIETSLTSQDDDYEDSIYMEVEKKGIYYMLMIDDLGLNISKATQSEPFEVDFLGKKIKIIEVQDGYDDRFTAIVGERYYQHVGDVMYVDGKQITLVNVGASGQIEVDVDGYQDMIPSNSVMLVNGIEIYLESTFYDSIIENRAAVMHIGNPAVEEYRDGDAYIGEDEVNPDWKWTIGNLGQTSVTEININGEGLIEATGPYIGIYNNFRATSASDNPVGIGDCYSLPNDYAEICLDSLSPDLIHLPMDIEYIEGMGLVHIYTPFRVDSLVVPHYPTIESNLTIDTYTNEVWLKMLNENEIGIYVDANEGMPGPYIGSIDISTGEKEFLRLDNQDTTGNNIIFKAIKDNIMVEESPGFLISKDVIKIKLDINGDSSLELDDGADDLVTIWLIEPMLGEYSYRFASLGLLKGVPESNEIIWGPKDIVLWEDTLKLFGSIGEKDEDHRSIYGIIIENPMTHGVNNRVSLKIPSDQIQANIIIKSKEIQIPPEEPLIVEILNPKNSLTINTDSVWLDVITNKDAVCSYTLKKCTIPEPEPEPEPIDCSIYDGMTCQEIIDYTNDILERPYAYCECGEILDMCTTEISSLACPATEPPEYGICIMNPIPFEIPTTDGLYHSILIEDILGSWSDDTKVSAELTVSCQDTFSNVVEDLITFIIDLTRQGIMEEYINLNTGWNLFSIPVTQSDTTVENVIIDIQDEVEVIYGYEQGQWKVWRNGHPANNLINLEAGKGYFIKLIEPVILHVEGTIGVGEPPVIPTFNVYQGWNLIGYYGTEDTIAFMALRNVWDKYSAIWTLFDNDVQALQGSLKGLGLEEFDEELKRTHGYWLYMQEDGIIVPTN